MFLGFLDTGVPCTLEPNPINEALMWATVRLKEHINVRADVMKVGMFKQALCKVIVSPLPERFMGNGYYIWLENPSST